MRHAISPRQSAGFTLMEVIAVIVIVGIVAAAVAVFIVAPVRGYVDSARRADLTYVAESAMRRMVRDLQMALPNSVRVSGVGSDRYLEWLPLRSGGRYLSSVDAISAVWDYCNASGVAGNSASDVLNFSASDTCFMALGTELPASQNIVFGQDWLVVLNASVTDPYNTAGVSTLITAATIIGQSGIQVTFPAASLSYPSQNHRFYIVAAPASYVCKSATNTLWRYWGYTLSPTQPVGDAAFTGAGFVSALLASEVDCAASSFSFVQSSAVVANQLKITRDSEALVLEQKIHVHNLAK